MQKMKISSEQIDSRTAIKGSTRRIHELLKPSSYKIRERSLAKNQRTKKSRGLNAAERVDKAHFIRGSLDFKAKNIATTLFRTEEFKNPKRAGAGSFFVQNKVRLSLFEIEFGIYVGQAIHTRLGMPPVAPVSVDEARAGRAGNTK